MANTPATLAVQCLRSVVINMESMPWSEIQYLPIHYQEHVLPESFIQVTFNLWPKHIRGESTLLPVKTDMIISEVLLLLRQKLTLENELTARLFQNNLPLEDDDVFQTDIGDYDCVFSASCKLPISISRVAEESKRDWRTASDKDVSIYDVLFRRGEG